MGCLLDCTLPPFTPYNYSPQSITIPQSFSDAKLPKTETFQSFPFRQNEKENVRLTGTGRTKQLGLCGFGGPGHPGLYSNGKELAGWLSAAAARRMRKGCPSWGQLKEAFRQLFDMCLVSFMQIWWEGHKIALSRVYSPLWSVNLERKRDALRSKWHPCYWGQYTALCHTQVSPT